MLLCFSFPALAQNITVTGTVSDNTGEPLIGASVMAKGTTVGTATDIDGNYTLSVAPDAVLVFAIGSDNDTRRCTHEHILRRGSKTGLDFIGLDDCDRTGSIALLNDTVAINTPRKTMSMMSGNEYADFITSYYGADSDQAAALGQNGVIYNTDWQKEILRTTVSSDYIINEAGLSEARPLSESPVSGPARPPALV